MICVCICLSWVTENVAEEMAFINKLSDCCNLGVHKTYILSCHVYTEVLLFC